LVTRGCGSFVFVQPGDRSFNSCLSDTNPSAWTLGVLVATMKNTYNIDLLRRRIQQALPRSLSPMGAAALEGFLSLPGASAWRPEKLALKELSYVFDIGLPLALIGDNLSARAHLFRAGDAARAGQYPDKDTWSEVHAAALLSRRGGEINFVAQSEKPPDIEVRLQNDRMVEVAVVRADLRRQRAEIHDKVQVVADRLVARGVEWNIVCFLIDAANELDLKSALDAATLLGPSDHVDDYRKRWAVRAIPPDRHGPVREPDFARALAPEWWPPDEPGIEVTSVPSKRLASQSPVLAVRSLISPAAYLNALERSAFDREARSAHPYLIAVDLQDMPHGHERVVARLDEQFASWTHVSGALLFEPRFWIGLEQKEWLYSVQLNPHATRPIPREIFGNVDGSRDSIRIPLLN
jgi:hypothetical protein